MVSFLRAGLRAPGWSRIGRFCLVALTTAVWPAGEVSGASAASGGGALPTPPAKTRPAAQTPSHGSGHAWHSPLDGRGMWIWYVSASSGGNLSSIINTSRTYGLSTLMIKSGDGTTAWPQFTPQLVSALHAAGFKACAWQYVYGNHPIYEAEVGAAAVRAGADCLVIDAEAEYQGRYVPAQEYVQKLRQLIGPRFPVALAGFPYVDYHPGFPYSVFLGPGGAQYNAPQMYWMDIGTSVSDVYAHTYDFNVLYQRPIEPLGEVSGDPSPGQVLQFRQLSRAYGATGVSWWDWQTSSLRDWRAIQQPVGNLAGSATQETLPGLSLQSQGGIWAGDLVVWAQEHLVKAGDPVQIDGSFGPATQAAVEQFQSAHALPVTGVVDQPTWQALLSYKAASVTWVKQPGKTVAAASRSRLTLTVPWSARLPARRDEIPPDLGAGTRP